MDLKILGYIVLFAIIGIPFVGFFVRNMIEFGRYVYRSFPFLQKFFDEYFEHYALGTVITVICAVVYAVLHFWWGLI